MATAQESRDEIENLTIDQTENIGSTSRLTRAQKNEIVHYMILHLNKGGRPVRGVFKTITEKYISKVTCSTIWRTANDQMKRGESINVSARGKGNGGRKSTPRDLSKLQEVPLNRRTSIRSLACAMDLSKSTAHRLVKNGLIKPHSNAIKPQLTEANKKKRVSHCLSLLQPNNLTSNPNFQDMRNMVHIDEKWFNMTKINQHYYLLSNEEDPYRTCKSKGFIGKVMFMCYVARRNLGDEEVPFDGKIGIFPFVTMEPTARNSKNRPKGTLEVKPIGSITKNVIRDCMIREVLPAIRAKWPPNRSKLIYIQQDNAKPHISPDDPEFVEASKLDGFDIRLTCQPPNSPDLNVLDLGWFRAIQTIQNELAPRTIQELVDCVVSAFNKMQATSLNYVWISIQSVMNEVLKCKGSNHYKMAHMGKHNLEARGLLPFVLEADSVTVQEAIVYLNSTQMD